MDATPALDADIQWLADYGIRGPLTVFLGAGASLDASVTSVEFRSTDASVGREVTSVWRDPWSLPNDRLPTAKELATWLANTSGYPEEDDVNLSRVAEWIALTAGREELDRVLRGIFGCRMREPGVVHQFFADHCTTLRRDRMGGYYPVFVTTNYDRLLEDAFDRSNEPLDVVTYSPRDRTLLVKCHGSHSAQEVKDFDHEMGLRPQERPVLVKVHGDVDCGFVITESDYLDFSTRLNLGAWLSLAVELELRKAYFLFLGYGLGDWNIRLALHRVLGNARLSRRSWAVQLRPRRLDCLWWERRDVSIVDMDLRAFMDRLRNQVWWRTVSGEP
jgi:hypothetical protein